MYNSFYLTKFEYDLAKVFESQHPLCGGGFEFSFSTGSGIGIVVSIQCNVCDAKADITDYGNW